MKEDSILDAEYLDDSAWHKEQQRIDKYLISQLIQPKLYFRNLGTSQLRLNKIQERLKRMGTKRQLLLKLAELRKFNKTQSFGHKLRYTLTDKEEDIYLSMMPKWKRFFVKLMWIGDHLSASGFLG